MSQQVVNNNNGIGFVSLLTLLFIGLKLGGIITWSWWWVLAPLWISTLIGVGFLLLALGVFLYTMHKEGK